MKLKIIILCFLLYSFSFIAIGSLSIPEVTGDVFIVTKGGINIKLGLVQNKIYSESSIKPFLKGNFEYAKMRITPLQPGLNEMKHKIEKLEKEYHEIKGKIDRQGMNNTPPYELQESLELAEKYLAQFNEYHSTYNEVLVYTKAEYYLNSFPDPLYTTKTDADGKFTYKLKPGKYAIVASTSRLVGEETEKYNWLIWFKVELKQQNKIMLSNDNLFENNSKDNLINIPELID